MYCSYTCEIFFLIECFFLKISLSLAKVRRWFRDGREKAINVKRQEAERGEVCVEELCAADVTTSWTFNHNLYTSRDKKLAVYLLRNTLHSLDGKAKAFPLTVFTELLACFIHIS